MSHMPVTSQPTAAKTVTNGESTSIVIGAPVYSFAAGSVKKAVASALATSFVVGIVNTTSIAAADSGAIATAGDVMAATTTQWDAVCATTGGLTFNTVYYLDPTTAGKMTATAPSTVGQCVVPLILALSTTTAVVLNQRPVLL